EKHGVGERTIRRDAEFAQAVDRIGATDPVKKEAILSGQSGQTKQQVTNANTPPILCDRCRRVGPVPDCKACSDARANLKGRSPHGTKPGRKRPKPGAVRFDWRKFSADSGALLRQVDVLGNAYRVKETPEAEALRAELDHWKAKFKALYRKAAQQEPPKE
ncbi:MAG TPA: hypothetical protein VKE94_24630, partial [Gemmataceae bacterium]|nr:hypothetical protein [Gemmataceae bacterium]